MNYGCIIVEDRPINVQAIIDRHKKHLPDWPVIHFSKLPYKINGWNDYNRLMTSWIWDHVPFDKVLIFQHDSGMLRDWDSEFEKYDYIGAPWTFQHDSGMLRDWDSGFEQYDYIGAPWTFQHHGGNGGFSWRNVHVMRQILKDHTYHPALGYEDVFYCNIMHEKGLNLAPRQVCERFSVEGVYKLGSMAYHNINKWLTQEQCQNILNQYR